MSLCICMYTLSIRALPWETTHFSVEQVLPENRSYLFLVLPSIFEHRHPRIPIPPSLERAIKAFRGRNKNAPSAADAVYQDTDYKRPLPGAGRGDVRYDRKLECTTCLSQSWFTSIHLSMKFPTSGPQNVLLVNSAIS